MITMTSQCARTLSLSQISICVSPFDLHGPSVVSPVLLAWLFSKKMSRYCHSPGVVGGSGVGGSGM